MPSSKFPPFFDRAKPEDDFKIRIDLHGQWFHEGTPMQREKLAKLFATALYYDEDRDEYWLVTPHEQGRIEVADAPFLIIDYELKDGRLTLITNLGHTITPDKKNPIYCDNDKPYCRTGNHVPVRLNRMVREKLIDIALSQNGYDETAKTLTLTVNDHEHIIARS